MPAPLVPLPPDGAPLAAPLLASTPSVGPAPVALGPAAVPVESALVPVGWLAAVERGVETATGPAGLGLVFAYSFLIAFALPGPSEVVLLAPLDLGLGGPLTLGVVVVTSAAGKALGSVVAFRLGREASQSGPVVGLLRRSGVDVVGWSERRIVHLARRYGYAGLAVALSVPFFPDTFSIYAFSVLEADYGRFAAATFAGSVGRLVVTLGLYGVGVAVL